MAKFTVEIARRFYKTDEVEVAATSAEEAYEKVMKNWGDLVPPLPDCAHNSLNSEHAANSAKAS